MSHLFVTVIDAWQNTHSTVRPGFEVGVTQRGRHRETAPRQCAPLPVRYDAARLLLPGAARYPSSLLLATRRRSRRRSSLRRSALPTVCRRHSPPSRTAHYPPSRLRAALVTSTKVTDLLAHTSALQSFTAVTATATTIATAAAVPAAAHSPSPQPPLKLTPQPATAARHRTAHYPPSRSGTRPRDLCTSNDFRAHVVALQSSTATISAATTTATAASSTDPSPADARFLPTVRAHVGQRIVEFDGCRRAGRRWRRCRQAVWVVEGDEWGWARRSRCGAGGGGQRGSSGSGR